MVESAPDAVRKPMKIRVRNIETLDVYYKGKKARFGGELVGKGFLAYADSMRWMEPVRDVPFSYEEIAQAAACSLFLYCVTEASNLRNAEFQ